MPVCMLRPGRPGAGPSVGDQPVDRGVQLERGRDGAPRVVAARERHAEEGHDLVADELVDGAAVALDHGGRLVLDPAHDRFDLLRVGDSFRAV